MTVCGYENLAQKSQLLFVFDGDYSDELTRLYTDCNLDLYQKRVSWLDVPSYLARVRFFKPVMVHLCSEYYRLLIENLLI